jgi:hypothetical protein
LSLVKLRKALCQRVFNSYTSKIHPHDFKKTLNLRSCTILRMPLPVRRYVTTTLPAVQ